MSIINFTVESDLYANGDDGDDVGVDADLVALSGSVTFTPVMADDGLVLAPDYATPTGFRLRPFFGWVESGRLKSGPGGSTGVRLWANDPVLGLDDLIYRVGFNLRTPQGEPVAVGGGYFAAPPDDRVVQLSEVIQSNSSLLGAPRIVAGTFADGAVVFENDDGSFVQAIDIPAGTVVFTDNGDGTWSAG